MRKLDWRGSLLAAWPLLCGLLLFGALAAAWKWTDLREWLNVATLIDFADRLDRAPYTPLAVILAYVAGGLIAFPLMFMIAATGAVFGPLKGALLAFTGALANAAVTYWVGRRLGRRLLQWIKGSRLDELRQRLAASSLPAVIIIRMIPAAPFTVVNMLAGASRLRLAHFLAGTLIGLVPGVTLIMLFVDSVTEALRAPGEHAWLMVGITAAVLAAFVLGGRLLRRLNKKRPPEPT